MFRIRRFSVINTANTVASMYLIMVLVIFIPVILILSVTQVTVTDSSGRQATLGMELFVLLLLPIIYGIAGWVFTALFCLLYNLTARFAGGIGVHVWRNLPDVVEAPPSATMPPPASGPPLQG